MNSEINSSTQLNSSLPTEDLLRWKWEWSRRTCPWFKGSGEQRTRSSDVTNVQVEPISLDINRYSGRELNDRTKERLIQNRVPDISYQFPIRKFIDKGAKEGMINRACSRDWFNKFEFITYSKDTEDLFYLPCVYFQTLHIIVLKNLFQSGIENWHYEKQAHFEIHSNMSWILRTTENCLERPQRWWICI